MPSEENKALQSVLAPLMKAHGYRKSGATWHGVSSAFIRVLNIQGSQFGKYFFINLGIFIRALGENPKPKEYDCHVRQRLSGLVSDGGDVFAVLDFQNDMPWGEREQALRNLVQDHALPWLEKKSDIEEIRNYLTREKLHGLPVGKEVYDYLGIDRGEAEQSLRLVRKNAARARHSCAGQG